MTLRLAAAVCAALFVAAPAAAQNAAHPAFGPLDVHQWILLLAGHSARHTAQIDEVTTAAGYPK